MLSFKHVCYSIKGKSILEDVSFNIKNGEKVLITGLSGSGKSTILNLICQNIEVTSGMIYYNKIPIQSFNEKKRNEFRQNTIRYLLQKDDLFDFLTVEDNLAIYFFPKDIMHYLKIAHMDKYAFRIVSSLSGGERQRISIIKSCMLGGDILLCDEITSSLDDINANFIIDFILKMFPQQTILFVSHAPDLFIGKIDHQIEIKNGKIKEIIFEDKQQIRILSKRIPRKTRWFWIINNCFKKIKFSTAFLFILSFLCFFITFNQSYLSERIAMKSYQNYFNYNVFEIKEGEISVDGVNVLYDLSSLIENHTVYFNHIPYKNLKLEPFYQEETNVNFAISKDILESYSIVSLTSFSFKTYFFTLDEPPYKIITEKGMFASSTIYYNYKIFNTLLKYPKTNQMLYIQNYIKEQDLFTNNPLFEPCKEKKPYLDSNAMKDYMTYHYIFSSLKSLIYYFFILITGYYVICSILLSYSSFLKQRREIGIFLLQGYPSYYFILTESFATFIYMTLLMIIIYFFLPTFLSLCIFPFLCCFLLQVLSILISFFLLKKKSIHDLLKEDFLC